MDEYDDDYYFEPDSQDYECKYINKIALMPINSHPFFHCSHSIGNRI